MGIGKLITGIAEVAAGAALDVFAGGAGGIGNMLIGAGVGTVMSGVGSMIQGDPIKGFATATRNPISPWRVCHGRVRTGGSVVYMHTWGGSDKVLDLVIILADHPSAGIDELLFDQQRIQIDTAAIPTSAAAGYTIPAPAAGSGTSFTPVQQTINMTSITRVDNLVTAVLPQDIPYLTAGDPIIIQNVPGDPTLNGTFQVAEIVSRVPSGGTNILTFTFLCGGEAATILAAGQARTKWVDYGRTVYFEPLLGNQQLGQTFIGMTAGVPWQGTGRLNTPAAQPNAGGHTDEGTMGPNPWTNYCSLQGKTAVFLRIQYDQKYYPSGLPQISFHLRGKNDIYDPRLGPCTGVKALGMSAAGSGYVASGMYANGDVLTLVQGGASGGEVTVTSVDSAGAITSYQVTAPGTGYGLGAATTTGGHGTGATFSIQALTGADGCNGYTENAVLCIADFLTHRTWGYKAAYGTDIPLAALEASADICDEAMALAGGGTEPRYALNGQFELSMKRGEILQNMLTACAGRITPEAPFFIQPGYWPGAGSPPLQIDLQAIAAGPYRWKGPAAREQFNGVKGTYVSPANKWQSTDYPYYAQDAIHGYGGPAIYGGDVNLAADGGERRWLELHLPFTISPSMAQRIAKIELLRRRLANSGTGTFDCNMAGYQLIALDVFEGTAAFLGMSNQLLEVTAARLKITEGSDAVLLGTEIDVQRTDSSVYAWSTGEELSTQGYQQTRWPQGTFEETAPLPWSPGYAAPLAGDAIGGAASFGIQPVYGQDAQGNGTAALRIKGTPPINALDTAVASPQIACTPSTTGGSIPPGTYVVGLTAYDSGAANHKDTDYQTLAVVVIPPTSPATATGSIAVAVKWGAGDDGGELYMGLWNAAGYVMHKQASLAPGAATATITSFDQTTQGGPDPLFDHFGVVWQKVEHGGVFAMQVQAVTATTITLGSYVAGDVGVDEFAGHILHLLAKADSAVEVPLLNMPVASNTASAGSPVQFVLTIGPNAAGVQIADLTTLLAVDDLMELRAHCTFAADSFSDPEFANAYYPTGADPAKEPGRVAVVLTGADAGDVQTIASVEADGAGNYTIFKLAGQWATTPATGDIVIVCDAAVTETPSDVFSTPNGSVVAKFAVSLENLANTPWLVRVRTEDANGLSGLDTLAPTREIFVFGAIGTLAWMQMTVDGPLAIDSDACPIISLPASRLPSGLRLAVKSAPTGADLQVSIWVDGSPATQWLSLTIPAGSTSLLLPAAAVAGAGPLPAGLNIRLSIEAVGTTNPGSDLSLVLYR